MERRKGSVTVKAEDRPSGLAGDSASVITFLFRFQPGLVEWRVLVAAVRQRRRSRIKDKHTPRLQIVFFVSRRKYRQTPLEEKSLLVQTRQAARLYIINTGRKHNGRLLKAFTDFTE